MSDTQSDVHTADGLLALARAHAQSSGQGAAVGRLAVGRMGARPQRPYCIVRARRCGARARCEQSNILWKYHTSLHSLLHAEHVIMRGQEVGISLAVITLHQPQKPLAYPRNPASSLTSALTQILTLPRHTGHTRVPWDPPPTCCCR